MDYLSQIKISKKLKLKLRDKKWLKRKFASGVSAQEILGISNETMDELYKAAILFSKKGDYGFATNVLMFLITLNPKRRKYWISLGKTMSQCGQYEQAIDLYEMAIYSHIF